VTAVAGSSVQVDVAVGYPMGTHTASVKGLETRLALEEGATEITLVPNLSAYKTGRRLVFGQEVAYVFKQAHLVHPNALVKVLIYLDVLNLNEQREVVRIVRENGASFLLLSRYDRQPVTPTAIRHLKDLVDPGLQLGVMSAIRTLPEAQRLLDLGLSRLLTPHAVDLVKEKDQV
jgi:deoxyribose-phosphate aldolase